MAIPKYPQENPDTPLEEFINHIDLKKYALEAKEILNEVSNIGLFVPQIQYKSGKMKNTCWYVALKDNPNLWLINFTIIPSNIHFEFRLPIYFPRNEKNEKEFNLWWQNNWPTFGFKEIGKENIISIIHSYVDNVRPHLHDKALKSRNKSSAEYFIKKDLIHCFPNKKVRHGERPIKYINGSFLELDLQIPELKFAIEVQGPTHYEKDNPYKNFDAVKEKDLFKIKWCKDNGIKLMHIKWDSYMKTLYKMPENRRKEKFTDIIQNFLESNNSFINIEDEILAKL